MTLDWLHIAALLGAIQGLFLAAILATQKRNRTANRLLAVLMVAFSIFLASEVYHAVGLEQVFPHFIGVGHPLPFLFGPLVYLYAVTASDSARRPTWWDALHFVPFAAVVLVGVPFYLGSGAEKFAFYGDLQRGVVPPSVRVVQPLKFVSGLAYAAATILFLRRHHARVKDNYSSIEHVNLQWLLRLATGAAAIWVLATSFEITRPENPLLRGGDAAVGLAIAILVYWIGYMALRQPEILNFAALDRRPSQPSGAGSGAGPATPASSTSPSGARYERSGLTDREAAVLKDALLRVMEQERLYQSSELTLADLADRLDTTPHKLSEVLNSELKQTFYDFVNAYRVRDVQRRIADERTKHLKILSLALDAGFASKSTFNHVFKLHTGRTPSTYRRSLSA